MAINFPAIEAPSFPLDPVYEDNVIRSEFENGSEQTRNKYTRIRVSWSLKWKEMTSADYAIFEAFYKTTTSGGALSFNWTHPLTAVNAEYRFTAPPKASNYEYDKWSVDVTIREV